jgi:hypothetical protein
MTVLELVEDPLAMQHDGGDNHWLVVQCDVDPKQYGCLILPDGIIDFELVPDSMMRSAKSRVHHN